MVISFFQIQGIDFEAAFIDQNEHSYGKIEETEPYLSREEAAAYARVSTDTIDNWCQRGDVKKIKLGGGKAGAVLICRKSLMRFIRRCSMKQCRVRNPYSQKNNSLKKGCLYERRSNHC